MTLPFLGLSQSSSHLPLHSAELSKGPFQPPLVQTLTGANASESLRRPACGCRNDWLAVAITPAGSGLRHPLSGSFQPSGRQQGLNPQKPKHSRKGCAGWGWEERKKASGPDKDLGVWLQLLPGNQISRQRTEEKGAGRLPPMTQAIISDTPSFKRPQSAIKIRTGQVEWVPRSFQLEL